ncbi:MAG: CRISPR-associated endonuclease Cas2 [Anaerolineales bacterium]|nr:CRISPR-associated endonuclease Cas2 [Anaerolineales bacterium]
MPTKQFWVIVYDISDDRRRTRLHTALLDYGTPVQYSVFECWVTAEQFRKLQARVRQIIRPRKDHVRYYNLCAACAARTQSTQTEITKPEAVMVV